MKAQAIKVLLLGACLCACAGKEQVAEELIRLDVQADFPKKELVLQDFMDVEYVPLETTDDFLTEGLVKEVGEKYVVVGNRMDDGNIYLFDRKTGKGVKKINRKGQGGEEYAFINGVVLDEENQELFVNSTSARTILVYDLEGNFKRKFAHPDSAEYIEFRNFDRDNLIAYDMSAYTKEGQPRGEDCYHAVISKKDGSLVRGIRIPFETIRAPYVEKNRMTAVMSVTSVTPYGEDFLLTDTSSDTAYYYRSKEQKLSPYLYKTVASDPEYLMTMGVQTDRYCFVQIIEKDFDFEKMRGFEMKNLMYDREEKAFYEAEVSNADFQDGPAVHMIANALNKGVTTTQTLPAADLVEARKEGRLQGHLNEIAAGLDEESNPVLVLMKAK